MALSPQASRERSRIAALSRSRSDDDPELNAARRDFLAAKAEAYIKKVLAEAPPLSDEQRNALAELLAPIRQTRAGGGA